MKEIWKDIREYEGLYQISNLGRVKSLDRDIIRKNGRNHHTNEKILTPSKNLKEYLFVSLRTCNSRKIKYIHRLVCEHFIPNQHNYSQVNHIDENKENNCINNLEWCTNIYNCNYGSHNKKIAKSLSKSLNQYDLNGTFIRNWKNSAEVYNNLKIDRGHISSCCNGKRKTAGGFIWKYEQKKE